MAVALTKYATPPGPDGPGGVYCAERVGTQTVTSSRGSLVAVLSRSSSVSSVFLA